MKYALVHFFFFFLILALSLNFPQKNLICKVNFTNFFLQTGVRSVDIKILMTLKLLGVHWTLSSVTVQGSSVQCCPV